jgi:large conductance mechanosensitive channel
MSGMKNAWKEFKAFAMGGNMLDLALGFIIGAAFAALVESLAGNVLMQLVAAIFGKPDFTELVLTVNNAEIKYGAFLTDFVGFLLMALVLFGIVKVLKKAGMGNFRAQGQRECPMCKEFVSVDALKCKWCTADIDPDLLEEEDLEILEARRRTGEKP